MNVELTMLTYSTILAFIMILIPATMKVIVHGLPAGVGNRDVPRPLTGWGARSERASANMLESLPIFAILVLIVQITGHNNNVTAMGAQLFFAARVAYALIYMAGITWVRTLVWLAAVAGMAMVGLALCPYA
jgi:uncharacterized MAPEG superfamily protein